MTGVLISPDHTRLLLLLWSEEGLMKKGDLLQRLLKQHERRKKYQAILDELLGAEAVALIGSKSAQVQLLPQGEMLLAEGLQDEGFEFGTQVGGRLANALLKWIRRQGITTPQASIVDHNGSHNGAGKTIASYDEFKQVALETFETLNRDFNLDNLVPIYRIRRSIGDRVGRAQFNEWLLEMQSDDLFQLLEGSVEDSAPDKIEDSITTKVSGLRCYAKRLTP